MRTIGITGGVGAGKSRVINYLKETYNAPVIVADELAHQLEEPGQCCYNELINAFGQGILKDDGYIEPKSLAQIIFQDRENLKKINDIVHPAVKESILQKMEEEREKGCKLFFLEAALLLEEGYDKILDEIWYIYASSDVRRQRLKDSRGYSDDKIDSIMTKQLSDESFRNGCDAVIDNSGDFEIVKKSIERLLGDIHG